MKRKSKTFSSSGKDCNHISGMVQKRTQGGQRDKAQRTTDSNTTMGNNTVPNHNELNGLS